MLLLGLSYFYMVGRITWTWLTSDVKEVSLQQRKAPATQWINRAQFNVPFKLVLYNISHMSAFFPSNVQLHVMYNLSQKEKRGLAFLLHKLVYTQAVLFCLVCLVWELIEFYCSTGKSPCFALAVICQWKHKNHWQAFLQSCLKECLIFSIRTEQNYIRGKYSPVNDVWASCCCFPEDNLHTTMLCC